MVNTNKLLGLMAEHGFTREKIAGELGISVQTLRRKLVDRKFDSDEMEKLIEILEIENPVEVFFA